ncbi:ASCH domain-containing protein [Kocuria atrinae]|uniref:ASCH domain-containing protein n=1 Tax=Kocuria atrinae TaxID=592377 RepID=A0ABN2Y360_9MICC
MEQDLRSAEFGPPGPLRDQLVRLILDGQKTVTSSLVSDYEIEGEALPEPGELDLLLDSNDRGVAVLETVAITVVPLGDIPWSHVVAEGEGHTSLDEWRRDHEGFWAAHSPIGRLDDSTPVVMQEFRVVKRLVAD